MVAHREPSGAPTAGEPRPRVAVVGGGIAGLTAATALAERGVRVQLHERERYLGGRVGSWPTTLADEHPVSMGRGFHAFFRQYYNLRNLLRRTDPDLDGLVGVADYPLRDAHGRTDSFRGLPRTPPWNALAFALRSPTFATTDLMRLNPLAALPLLSVRVPDVYHRLDHLDAESYLEAVNFPEPARHLAFEVFSRSFFAAGSELSAAELATMFHLYFLGSSEGLLFDLPREDFATALWDPLAAYLRRLGVDIRLGSTVNEVSAMAEGGFHLAHGAEERTDTVDAVVLAAELPALQRLLQHSPRMGPPGWRADIAALPTAPAFLVERLWLARPVAEHRPAFLATAGTPPLDNISLLDRYEGSAARWARRTGGSVVELHAYAQHSEPGGPGRREPAGLRQRLRARLGEIYPETATAPVVDRRSQWRQDCPLFAPGTFAGRPRVPTPVPGLVLAGDAIRIDLPVALMERASATGWHAANCLLASWGLAGHRMYSVPTRGLLPPLPMPGQPARNQYRRSA